MDHNKGDIIEEHFGTRDFVAAYKEWDRQFFEDACQEPKSSTLTLPYSLPANELPAPIPTAEEITNQCSKQNSLTEERSLAGFPVYKINGYTVKFKHNRAILQEAENMLFLEQNTTIRIPKLYAAFAEKCNPENKPWPEDEELPLCYFIIMEFIEGETLDTPIWNQLDREGKRKIGTEFGQMFEKLHQVPSSGYYGRVNHQGFPATFPLLRTHYKEEIGPLHSYKELVDGIYEANKLSHSMSTISDGLPSPEIKQENQLKLFYLKKELLRCGNQESRLTYLDPKWDNVILKPTTPNGKIEGTDFEVVFIDWYHLGWLPAWFQSLYLPLVESRHEKDYGHNDGKSFNWDIIKAMPSFLLQESIWIPKVVQDTGGIW